MRNSFVRHLNEQNHHIMPDQYGMIRDILFRYYNPYILHDINPQEYLLRTLCRREGTKASSLIDWFKCFLCEPCPDTILYRELLTRWTNCFFDQQQLFQEIISQIDTLMELWTQAVPTDEARSAIFAAHMAAQCFRQSKYASDLLSLTLLQ